ncbi:MAG: sulfite exporter TauE/SafE family protein [Synechococcales bacterium]|nr:sulfite exporter TauE/SafE family protein [Synechococcales bacterium]
MTIAIATLLAMFLAAFVQSVAGFGFALVAMPILANTTSLTVVTPLVAITGMLTNTLLWAYYRHGFHVKIVMRLLVASLLGIPVGLVVVDYLPEGLTLMGLGAIVATYALYSLVSPVLPPLKGPGWAYGFGFTAGLLAGSYNIPGPPVVFYCTSRGWTPDEFKSNLTGFFWLTAIAVILGHALGHRLTAAVGTNFLLAIPAVLLGMGLGIALAHRIDAQLFRRIILTLLVGAGLQLISIGLSR